MLKKLRRAENETMIDKIPDNDEWWSSSSRETYLAAANELVELGWTLQDASGFLSGLYWAAAEEYGG